MPGDRDIIRKIYVDNGFSPNYYRFERNLDAIFDVAGHVVSFTLPIQTTCNLTGVPQLRHLLTFGLKKGWQSRVPVPDLEVLHDHATLERVTLESVLLPNPNVLAGLNVNRIKGLAFRFMRFAAWEIIGRFKALEDLELYLHDAVDWGTICALETLRHLRVFYGNITSLTGIASLKRLQTLAVMYNPGITSIAEVASLPRLETLQLSGTRAKDLSPLWNLPRLKILEWHECPGEDFSPIAALSHLQELDLYRTKITDCAFLANLHFLQTLNLEGTFISNLESLARLHGLHNLNLSWSPIHDLTPLAGLSRLKILELNGTKLQDLAPLAEMSALEELSLIDATCEDLSPLADASLLRLLHLREGQTAHMEDQLLQLERNRPDLHIELYPAL